MRPRIIRTATAGVALALTAALTACGGSTPAATTPAVVAPPASLITSGTLTYGTAASFAPFESKGPDGQPQGFDIDMITALATSMGLQAKPLDIDFDGLIPALGGKRTDIINSAMYITPARAQQVDFVPYLVIGEALLVPAGNPKQIAKVPDDLSGKTVAVTRGAIGETYMNEFNAQLAQRGLPPMTIMSLPNNQDAMLAVRSGRADTFDTSTPGAAATLAGTPGTFAIAATFKNETKIGIAVRKGDTATAAALTKALELFESSGGYAALMAKYQLPAESKLLGTAAASATPTAAAGG